ncbi:hypothetical protein OXPF_43050 [Oxobacter pfennigii]|uniref:Uncharacterized protein n=1 Tax=Oxobacter pfennigii TaxID=36849 RepID=A0A0N8NSN4_9CLOT|nr:hypothetical protein [Oxobacter pfennigii]KPU42520.1 hypothetical protein OXPF_43050 [Oxobacter pfennigii]
MKTAKAKIYDAHKYYNVPIDVELLNKKIKIYDENFENTGIIFYEGSVGKFLKERNPSEYLVNLLIELKGKDKISYKLSNVENFIERI